MTQVWDVQDDPMAAAMEADAAAEEADRRFRIIYGFIEFDPRFVVLQKGAPGGKAVFDPNVHDAKRRLTAIEVAIQPVAGSPSQYSQTRDFIAEFRNEGWLKVTLPSIKALGLTLPEVNKRYIKAEMVRTGETFEGTKGIVHKDAPKILAVYASEDEAMAAANAETTQVHRTSVEEEIPTGLPTNGHSANGGSDTERATALSFLPALLKQARNGNGMDLSKVEEIIKANPLLNKYFSLTSPEVIEATQQILADAEPAF
jgi:hypothetical protein